MEQRVYENMYIVHPEVVGENLTAVTEKFKGIVTDQGGTVLRINDWGSRTLAYPIKKLNKGSYFIMYFQADPQHVSELERRMRLDDNILRFTTLRHDKGIQLPKTEEEVAEEAAPAEEAAE